MYAARAKLTVYVAKTGLTVYLGLIVYFNLTRARLTATHIPDDENEGQVGLRMSSVAWE